MPPEWSQAGAPQDTRLQVVFVRLMLTPRFFFRRPRDEIARHAAHADLWFVADTIEVVILQRRRILGLRRLLSRCRASGEYIYLFSPILPYRRHAAG